MEFLDKYKLKIKNFFDSYEKRYLWIENVTWGKEEGLRVLVGMEKEIKYKFRKPFKQTRKLKLMNYRRGRGQQFYFFEVDCPETAAVQYHDSEGWYIIGKMECEKHPWMPLNNKQIQGLVDKWFEKNNIVASGSWDKP
jgi:hypothetical protein